MVHLKNQSQNSITFGKESASHANYLFIVICTENVCNASQNVN